jgi:predicted nucleic acid-binding protein
VTVTCVDSSALLRLCFEEGDLTLAERAISNIPTASAIAFVEVPCAIAGRLHRSQITTKERDRFTAYSSRLLEGTAQIGLTVAVRREAVAIAERFLVRALDAIHLATAVVVARRQRRRGQVVRFCTADLPQAKIASALLGANRVDVVPPLPRPPREAGDVRA